MHTHSNLDREATVVIAAQSIRRKKKEVIMKYTIRIWEIKDK
jgi:hypothetical protein